MPTKSAHSSKPGGARKRVSLTAYAAPQVRSAAAVVKPPAGAAVAARGLAPAVLTRSLKRFVVGCCVTGLALPAGVLMLRSVQATEALGASQNSQSVLACVGGFSTAADASGLVSWLFSGSVFRCNDWETREARVQRERDQAEANYLARLRQRQQQ